MMWHDTWSTDGLVNTCVTLTPHADGEVRAKVLKVQNESNPKSAEFRRPEFEFQVAEHGRGAHLS